MCGTLLEARRPASVTVANPPAVTAKIQNAQESQRIPVVKNAVENAAKHANTRVPAISGPSVLGLNQPDANRPEMDSPRESAFSGLHSFLEPEQPKTKTGGRRILLLVALLAALCGAGWWTYSYLDAAESRKSEAVTEAGNRSDGDTPRETPTGKPSTKISAQDAAPAPDAGSSQVPAPSTAVPEGPSENANASPDAVAKTADSEAKPATKATPVIPRVALGDKSAEKGERRVTSAKASKLPEPAATDTGTADFHRGEAYLYGRGVPENCDEAVKYLKSSSAKSNAKARSAFGTMYATGHCVPRDLPTSYLWFAMALRVDPNNQILEKDLSAVWNQMTPPERQLATRMKQ
jgi:hypothetical protein